MAKLTSAARNALPDSEFAEPKERKYPVNNPSHARNALARVSQHGDAEEKAEVRGKVQRKYPGIKMSAGKSAGKRKMVSKMKMAHKSA